MQCVQFSEIVSGAVAELDRAKPFQIPFFREPSEDLRRRAFEVAVMGKTVTALADVDGSQLSGPFVYVANKCR